MSRARSAASSWSSLEQRWGVFGASRTPLILWAVLSVLGTTALVCAMVPVGPQALGEVGAVVIGTCFTWALAARTGGRPMVFGALALAFGVAALISDQDLLRTGAAVGTASVAAVLAVIGTVPAGGLRAAIRECVLALTCSAIGALAAIGFNPAIQEERFEYVSLGLAFVSVVGLVYRLGAGFHGLGRRGLIIVGIGALMLAGSLLYAELLRRYGSSGLVDWLLELVRSSREDIGAFPRPILAVLGVPALVYGCHMRARRRQGWWVCAFGVAATSITTTSLGNPAIGLDEALLSVVYGMLIGILIGLALIRLDLALTGNRGRRSRVAERAAALRPEPSRFSPLL